MKYTKIEIIKECELATRNMNTFYQNKIINYQGKTSDTHEYYNEVIAEYLLNHFELFNNIQEITRSSSYYVDTHDGNYNHNSNREEEIIAMQLFNQNSEYNYIGKIIDYQTPLKNTLNDQSGKIDLLAYTNRIIRLLELKKEDSEETMLRCVLEGYTYLKTVNKAKLINDFNNQYPFIDKDSVVKASPLVFKDQKQYLEYQEDRKYLKALMKRLDCKPFFIVKNDKYEIRED